MIQTGQILNDTYEVLESLGSGTGGIIFKAYHKRMKKYVAIKLIKNELRDKTDIRLEIDVLKNLKHEFLPQVIDFFEAENDVYTVIEFIEGKNFKQLVKEGHTFTEEQVRKYGMQLCSAVEYLHSQNPPIIHSDIKPANIMLTPQDNICLIDFNISTVSNDGTAVSKGGSSGFAAPEQFRRIIDVPVVQDDFHEETRFIGVETDISTSNPASNIAFIDLRTDIYGVGASLYYILTQRSPVDGKMDFNGINASKAFKSALIKATNTQASKRFRSAAEFAAEIKKISESRNRKKTYIIGAVVLAAAIITTAIFTINSFRPQENTAASRNTENTRILNANSKLVYTNVLSYCNKCKSNGISVADGWYSGALADGSDDFVYDGSSEDMAKMLSHNIGGNENKGYFGVNIRNNTPEISFWSPDRKIKLEKITGLNQEEIIEKSLSIGIYPDYETLDKDEIIVTSVTEKEIVIETSDTIYFETEAITMEETTAETIIEEESFDIELFEHNLIELINIQRRAEGASELKYNFELENIAFNMCNDVINDNCKSDYLEYNNQFDAFIPYYGYQLTPDTQYSPTDYALAFLQFVEAEDHAVWSNKEWTYIGVAIIEDPENTYNIVFCLSYNE